MQSADLLELRDDLSRESSRLQTLVTGLSKLGQRLDHSAEAVEASALRLHSFYTGVERMLLLVSRVVNGGTPAQGEGWHRHQASSTERSHTSGAAGVFAISPPRAQSLCR